MHSSDGEVITPTDEGDRMEYLFSKINDVEATLAKLPRTRKWRVFGYKAHLSRNYSLDLGAKKLGYTVLFPYIEWLVWKDGSKPTTWRMVACKEGSLSMEEAMGNYQEMDLPTEEQVRARAWAIRLENGNSLREKIHERAPGGAAGILERHKQRRAKYG